MAFPSASLSVFYDTFNMNHRMLTPNKDVQHNTVVPVCVSTACIMAFSDLKFWLLCCIFFFCIFNITFCNNCHTPMNVFLLQSDRKQNAFNQNWIKTLWQITHMTENWTGVHAILSQQVNGDWLDLSVPRLPSFIYKPFALPVPNEALWEEIKWQRGTKQ